MNKFICEDICIKKRKHFINIYSQKKVRNLAAASCKYFKSHASVKHHRGLIKRDSFL